MHLHRASWPHLVRGQAFGGCWLGGAVERLNKLKGPRLNKLKGLYPRVERLNKLKGPRRRRHPVRGRLQQHHTVPHHTTRGGPGQAGCHITYVMCDMRDGLMACGAACQWHTQTGHRAPSSQLHHPAPWLALQWRQARLVDKQSVGQVPPLRARFPAPTPPPCPMSQHFAIMHACAVSAWPSGEQAWYCHATC